MIRTGDVFEGCSINLKTLQERFPDPKALAKDLHSIGIKAIWMLDPGIKYEEGYHVYDSGSNSNLWIEKEDGKPFVGKAFKIFYILILSYDSKLVLQFVSLLGEVWPGPCVFPDFTRKEARLWWANLVKDFVSNGVDGIWNDMNEPAVFKVSIWELRLAVFLTFF